MDVLVSEGDALKHASDAVAYFLFSGEKPDSRADAAANHAISAAVRSGEFSGKEGQVSAFRAGKTLIVVAGLGKRESFYLDLLRRASGRAASRASEMKCRTLAAVVVRCPHDGPAEAAAAIADGVILSSYSFDKYQKKEDEKQGKLEKLAVFCAKAVLPACRESVRVARILCDSENFARSIANEPANEATPSFVAEKARVLSKSHGLKCTVYGPAELKKMGMNALLSVARGSTEPCRLAVLEYRGGGKTVAVVGKGITFDSGGISIKPSKDMEKMKYDKAGACAVLGIMKAASELKLKVNVVGIMPLTENLPSGSASKPGDIVRAYSGKSIEILNTDAEGRLVLADALAFAEDKFRPDAVIDLATLTGACVVALGDVAAGVLGRDDSFVESARQAGEETGERAWPMPLWPDYSEKIKGDFAEIRNIGIVSGDAGLITAAAFLKEFVKAGKWVHFDIAGVAWNDSPKAYRTKGATGFGVRLVSTMLRGLSQKA